MPTRKLTPDAVCEMRHRYSDGETSVALAAEFGVSPVAARRAISGQSYARLPVPPVPIRPPGALRREQVATMRYLFADGDITMETIADLYGVSANTVRSALRGRSYADAGGPVLPAKPRHRKPLPYRPPLTPPLPPWGGRG